MLFNRYLQLIDMGGLELHRAIGTDILHYNESGRKVIEIQVIIMQKQEE